MSSAHQSPSKLDFFRSMDPQMATEHLDQSSIQSTPEMMTFRNCNRWFHSKRKQNPCFNFFLQFRAVETWNWDTYCGIHVGCAVVGFMTRVDQGSWTSLNNLELGNELAQKKKAIQAIPYIKDWCEKQGVRNSGNWWFIFTCLPVSRVMCLDDNWIARFISVD